MSPGITRTVTWLNQQGFKTTDSGDGYSNAGMGCELDFPNVTIQCSPYKLVTKARQLMDVLRKQGVEVQPINPENPTGPHIEANFDPSDGIAVILLMHVNDKLLFGD
jgi:hypothetical protein